MTRKIIGLAGFIGCGKDTVGDLLVDTYNFTKISYADRLKDTVSVMFGWDRKMLEGTTPESRLWRETPDEFWTTELGYAVTPRHVLQRVGTDCMRQGFNDQVWVLTVKKILIENPTVNFVVTDVRFINERKLLKDLGGEVWRIKRGPDPEWTQKAISDNRYDTQWMKDYPEIHESEWRWLDHSTEFDRNIHNDSGLPILIKQVEQAMCL